MWGYGDLIEKAKVYFNRAARHDSPDDEFALWLILGLEFLIRAPLARKHPALLAEGESVLHAAGIVAPEMRPKSISSRVALERLRYIVPDFDRDRAADANSLLALRNAELHSADFALRNTDEKAWLPRFLSVLEVLCRHLDLPPEELVGPDVIRMARALRVEVDKAVEREVSQLISKAKWLYSHLNPNEVAERKSQFRLRLNPSHGRYEKTSCPVCNNDAEIFTYPGRTTGKRYDEEKHEFIYTTIYMTESFNCNVCGLALENASQAAAAGLQALHTREVVEGRYEGWEDVVGEDEIRDIAENLGFSDGPEPYVPPKGQRDLFSPDDFNLL